MNIREGKEAYTAGGSLSRCYSRRTPGRSGDKNTITVYKPSSQVVDGNIDRANELNWFFNRFNRQPHIGGCWVDSTWQRLLVPTAWAQGCLRYVPPSCVSYSSSYLTPAYIWRRSLHCERHQSWFLHCREPFLVLPCLKSSPLWLKLDWIRNSESFFFILFTCRGSGPSASVAPSCKCFMS